MSTARGKSIYKDVWPRSKAVFHALGEINYSNSEDLLTTNYISSVQLLSGVRLFATPWTAARQASLPITNSRSLPKLTVYQTNYITGPIIRPFTN